jgi:hypothetical protein
MQWSADLSRSYLHRYSPRYFHIWSLPLDGGSAVQLTDFKDRSIPAFAWSRDGKQTRYSALDHDD